ncbi:MAG TPA: hypothetical protein VJB60_04330 [Candidatus Peribacterales bacterium]|uniref:Uncharacterized protein n=1 Tax=Candidatus Kaiserbacteria bacterium RIFCSPHIGHO2_01_FULL_56_24 TaxID=1798487 RepID=A0A1F6DGJ5_9BACT|nr:MAG: hypothetical protein A2765_01270 [Candidatus Kaiserbacteria bacterium RIFCSPHIGHO2_01_FULL_56_24]HLD08266.1 hypothetical protein [Candidatus Peribacterales bacterium]
MKHNFSLILFGSIFLTFFSFASVSSAPSTPEQILERMPEQCKERMDAMFNEEITLYRAAQFGSSEPSVLKTTAANTSDLVPYLVQNYHALDCRLHLICDAIGTSQNQSKAASMVLSHRPLGCARLFAARGRWWSADRRGQTFRVAPIAECAFGSVDAPSYTLSPTEFLSEQNCDAVAEEILSEERSMLRLITMQDAAERGTRRIVPVFQNILLDIRQSFLVPLRGMVDLFGSVIHPIPCLLQHCN